MRIDENIKILKPIADRILKSESDKCVLSEIPQLFQSLKNDVATELDNTTMSMNDKHIILTSISNRRDFCLQPIHFAANVLDPRYRGMALTDEEIVKASDLISRLATHLKKEVSTVLSVMCDLKTKTGHFGLSDTMWIVASRAKDLVGNFCPKTNFVSHSSQNS